MGIGWVGVGSLVIQPQPNHDPLPAFFALAWVGVGSAKQWVVVGSGSYIIQPAVGCVLQVSLSQRFITVARDCAQSKK
jgi:hypothetical protein